MHLMETKLWQVEIHSVTERHPAIQEAANLLQAGEVIAFPTETVYGLGANALSDSAVQKIFAAKGRPADNPLIIHLYDRSQLERYVRNVPSLAISLLDAFTPGPLTIIFESNGTLSSYATAGLTSVGIRFPDHKVARAILQACDLPIAAPSANRSGRPSPTEAIHVQQDLGGKIAGIVDGGSTGVGVESTVIDVTLSPPMILRPGGITREQIEQVIGPVQVDPALLSNVTAPRSPGMKYRHYAPEAPIYLVGGETIEEMYERLLTEAQNLIDEGKKVGILTTQEGQNIYETGLPKHRVVIEVCGQREKLETVAQSLYHCLRKFDGSDIDVILAEVFPTHGIGTAIMNRLEKAAGGKYI